MVYYKLFKEINVLRNCICLIFKIVMDGKVPIKFQLGEPRMYGGMYVSTHADTDAIEELMQHTFDPADILITSFPKSGEKHYDSFT